MMTKHIIKQIWNERRSNSWLWAELLLVSVALWVIVDWGYVQLSVYLQPRGFNYENTYQLRFNHLSPKSRNYLAPEQKTTTDGEDFLAVVERLRRHPDIEYISVSNNSSPYNGSNSGYGLRHDTLSFGRLTRQCTPDFFNVFQYQNADGSGSQSLADALTENSLVVSYNLHENYPQGKGLLGEGFYVQEDSSTLYRVAALTKSVRYSDFSPIDGAVYFALLLSESDLSQLTGSKFAQYEICVRTRPGVPSADFMDQLLKDAPRLYDVGNCYVQNIESFDAIRHSYQIDLVNEVQKRAFILLFLLVNIFLGIIGTFWYRTQQRRSELGLRVALGASHRSLSSLLISEGILILLFAFLPAMIICYNIGLADLMGIWQIEWGLARFIPGMLITLALMLLMIVIGIWFPARQAMTVQPAEALHEE